MKLFGLKSLLVNSFFSSARDGGDLGAIEKVGETRGRGEGRVVFSVASLKCVL